MSLEIQCGKCGKCYGVPDHHAGKQVQCPNCRQLIPIPRVAFVEPEPGFPSDLQPAPSDPMTALLDDAMTARPLATKPEPWRRPAEPLPDISADWPPDQSSGGRWRVDSGSGRMKTRTLVIGIILLSGGLFVAAIVASASFIYSTFKNLDSTISPKIDALFAAIDDGTFGDLCPTETTPEFRQRVSQEEWKQLAAAIKLRLGHLETKTLASFNVRQFNTQRHASVSYSASFEKGRGTVEAMFERFGEDWRLEGFVVTSPELLKVPPSAVCPHCGKTYTVPAKFCPACGKPAVSADANHDRPIAQPKGHIHDAALAAQSPATPSARPVIGQMKMFIGAYQGQGDPQTAARRALRGIAWLSAETARVDLDKHQLVVGVVANTVNTQPVREALDQAGFVTGPVSVGIGPKAMEPDENLPSTFPIPPTSTSARPPSAPASRAQDSPTSKENAADWSMDGGLRVSIGSSPAVTFGPLGCRKAVIGHGVWDLTDGTVVQQLQLKYSYQERRALSDSGKWFAVQLNTNHGIAEPIGVFSTEMGEQVLEIPGQKERQHGLLAFSRDKYLLHGLSGADEIEVWDVEERQVAKKIRIPNDRLDAEKIAFTPDGRFFAYAADRQLAVFSTAGGRKVAWMANPGPLRTKPEAAESPRWGMVDGPQPLNPATEFSMDWFEAIAFSPDGKELAMVSRGRPARLVCWDSRGKVVFDAQLLMEPGLHCKLSWLPDGSGWFVDGCLVDRESKRVLMKVKADEDQLFVLDRSRVLAVMGWHEQELREIAIPWDKLRASLALMDSREPSLLSPYQAISVRIEIDNPRGDRAQTEKTLREALTERLALQGTPVAEGRPTSLRVRLAEQAGERLPIVEGGFGPIGGKPTGRSAVEAKGSLVVELVTEGCAEPLWKAAFDSTSDRMFFDEPINDQTIRNSMLEPLVRQLQQIDIPYFLPRAPENLALPLVVR